MIEIISVRGIDIYQKNFSQVLLRGKDSNQLKQYIKNETNLEMPTKNLNVIANENFLIGQHSFDQWSLIYLQEAEHQKILKIVSSINQNEDLLASDYSYGQVYFEITGDKKDYYLNKLTHFDLRLKKFENLSLAQTLVARIDCTIYKLDKKYLITCNKSFEDYFKKRLLDAVNL
tara:strand:+ start:2496 stop:3017 length:522 start_codon:yes stop_codon:yes gene_type:complete